MNNNVNQANGTQTRLREILSRLEQVESLQSLIVSNECAGIFSLSRQQQADIFNLSASLSLDARCRLAAEIGQPKIKASIS